MVFLIKVLVPLLLFLLPKVAGADDIKQFRPISLEEGVYKILAKVLDLRLRKIIGKLLVEVNMLSLQAAKFWMHL